MLIINWKNYDKTLHSAFTFYKGDCINVGTVLSCYYEENEFSAKQHLIFDTDEFEWKIVVWEKIYVIKRGECKIYNNDVNRINDKDENVVEAIITNDIGAIRFIFLKD